jgi:hypothetical protein
VGEEGLDGEGVLDAGDNAQPAATARASEDIQGARAEAASLAGEGHEALKGGVATPKPREAMGRHSIRKELAKLLLDEAGQAVAVAAVRGFPKEGLNVLADDGVEDGVLGRGADTW